LPQSAINQTRKANKERKIFQMGRRFGSVAKIKFISVDLKSNEGLISS
jgi:hypothetical protein